MIQKDLTNFYENHGASPKLINSDGNEEELNLTKFYAKYLCLVVFRSAFEEISSSELVAFSESMAYFNDLDCQVMGVSRDSPMVLQEWLMDLDSAKLPCISCQNLVGFIQAIGVPLVDGFPIPSIIITDKKNKVRYFASFHYSIGRSVKETFRAVAAIKMVDDGKGTELAPADWVQGEPIIRNTKAGVKKYYKELYKGGDFSFPRKIFRSFYDRLLGYSLPVEKMIKKIDYASLKKDTDTIKTKTKELKSTEDTNDKVSVVATALGDTDIDDYCPSDDDIMCDCSVKFYHSKNIHELSNLKKSN